MRTLHGGEGGAFRGGEVLLANIGKGEKILCVARKCLETGCSMCIMYSRGCTFFGPIYIADYNGNYGCGLVPVEEEVE